MSTCTLKERLHSIAIGICLAVVLMGFGWCAVTFTWASSSSILNTALSRTGPPMAGCSVLHADAPASLLAWRQAAADQ
ncbi:MAG: hypothetical protein KKH22_04465 [Proteobacteria bacterium]|nr:hypothetical protein [Pseudomonadota bacterium]